MPYRAVLCISGSRTAGPDRLTGFPAGTYAAGQALPVSFREEKLLFFWGAGQNFRILL